MDFCNLPCSDKDERSSLPLATPFVRHQSWEEPMEPARSLCAGTVFASLSMPLSGYCWDCDSNCVDSCVSDDCSCRKGRDL